MTPSWAALVAEMTTCCPDDELAGSLVPGAATPAGRVVDETPPVDGEDVAGAVVVEC